MNKQSITFSASEQTLEKTGGIDNYASNIVSYVEATFTLGENWTGYDVVRAVWESAYAKISTVLDSDHKCVVPAEVLRHKSKVNVNLVGSIVTNDVLTDRLTTYPVHAITVDADARVDSTETQPITPSQFEQFVEAVHADAESIQDYSYDSEAWAKGTRGGVAVPSTDPTYHNNSKYYADQGAELEQEVSDLKSDFKSLVNESNISIELGAFASGFMQKTGVAATNAQTQYASASITDDLVGKKLYVSGTSWYDVKPYVFVGNSIVYPDVDTGSTLTQYTDLEFTPSETGTLYINKFDSGNTHHIGKAFYEAITSIKPTLLPKPLPVTDIVNYEAVDLTTISNRLLNGSTGVITSSDQASYVVTDYTEVTPNSKVMVTTQHFYGSGLYAFYDSAKNFISGSSSASGGTPTKVYCSIVDVSSNAKYIVIGLLYQSNLFPACYLWQGIEQNALPSKRWNGLKWTCVGDSLTDYNKRTSIHYFDYIAGATGIGIYNMGKSGSGYYKLADDGSANFMNRIANVPLDSDVVTIFGSGNDLSTGLPIGTASDNGTATLGGVINATIDNLYDVMPVANLGIVTPTPWINQMPLDNGTMESYANLIVEICRRRSIPCLDLYHCSNLNPNSADVRQIAYSHDDGNGVHPNEIGHKMIATHFKAFLETLLL